MERSALRKNVFLLAVGSILALHLQVAKASGEVSGQTISQDEEECVIKEDQYIGIR